MDILLVILLMTDTVQFTCMLENNTEKWMWLEKSHKIGQASVSQQEYLSTCEDVKETSERCLLPVKTPMSWNDAHSYCRSWNGFLPGEQTYHLLPADLLYPNGNKTWTALTAYRSYYQWLSYKPGYSSFILWDKEEPKMWDRECVLFVVKTGLFYPTNCTYKLAFFCEMEPNSIRKEQLGDDIRLQINSNQEKFLNWIDISEGNFSKLLLQCNILNNFQNISMSVFWSQDGIFLGHQSLNLHPHTLYNPIKYQLGTHNLALRQGAFQCHLWSPASEKIVSSESVLITISEYNTLIFNVVYDKNASFNLTLQKIKRILKKQISDVDELPMDLISVTKTANTVARFRLYAAKETWIDMKYKIPAIESALRDSGFFEGTYVKLATFCLPTQQTLPYGSTIHWPYSVTGDVFPEKYKCETENKTLKSAKCLWNYDEGAKISYFTKRDCSRFERCPAGYVSIANNYCVVAVGPLQFFNAMNSGYRMGVEFSIIDKKQFFIEPYKEPSVIQNLKEYAKHSSNNSLLWLPLYRVTENGPFVHVGATKTDFKVHDTTYMQQVYGISWKQNNPNINKKCVAIDLRNNELLSYSCSEKLFFISLVDTRTLAPMPSNLGPCSNNDSYFSSLDLESGICILETYKSKNTFNVSYSIAIEMCRSQNFSLPSPGKGFLNWMYKKLASSYDQKFWIDVIQKEKLFLSNNSLDIVNWLPKTDYSQTYGIMNKNGWWLEEKENVSLVVCQEKLKAHKLVMTISFSNTINLCISNTNLVNKNMPLRCYFNGFHVKLSRRNDSVCQYEIQSYKQGFYSCIGWSVSPVEIIYSNIYFYKNLNLTSYAILLEKNEKYTAVMHDSTFNPDYDNFKDDCQDLFIKSLANKDMVPISYSRAQYSKEGDKTLLSFIVNFNYSILLSFIESKLQNDVIMQNKYCYVKKVRSTFECPEITEIDFINKRNITWAASKNIGIFFPIEPCIAESGLPITKECTGNFIAGFHWKSTKEFCRKSSSNTTVNLLKFYNMQTNRIDDKSDNYYRIPKFTSTTNASTTDMFLLSSFIQFITNKENKTTVDLENVVSALNNAMLVNNSSVIESQININMSSHMLINFEKIFLEYTPLNQSVAYNKQLISVEKINLSKNIPLIGYQAGYNGTDILSKVIAKGDKLDYTDTDVIIILPDNFVQDLVSNIGHSNKRNASILFAVYRNDKLFKSSKHNDFINSPILQVSVSNAEIEKVDPPLKISFKPSKEEYEANATCVYWNISEGEWQSDGCWVGEITQDFVTCYCSHMTCFAILISFEHFHDEEHEFALDLISIVGCCLSLFGTLIVILTFSVFKKWRTHLGHKILLHFALAQFGSVSLFLAIGSTSNAIICKGIAITLHYFILASFGWMLVEAVHQYLRLVKVIGTYIPGFIWKAAVAAWGLPVLPIIISVLFGNYYKNEGYICWISQEGFSYTMLPILATTMATNLIIYALIIKSVFFGGTRLKSTLTDKEILLTQLRMAICVFFLLGFTWIFGILTIANFTIVFSYLFCIFNTLQGFFLFFFHVFWDKQTRKLWIELLFAVAVGREVSYASRNLSSHNRLSLTGSTIKRQNNQSSKRNFVSDHRISTITQDYRRKTSFINNSNFM